MQQRARPTATIASDDERTDIRTLLLHGWALRHSAAGPFQGLHCAARKVRPMRLLLAAVPFIALTFAVPFVNRDQPRIAGIPFLLCWIDRVGAAWRRPFSGRSRVWNGTTRERHAAAAGHRRRRGARHDWVSPCSRVRRIKMDPQQYMVGGRSFGTIFLWVLLAGEIYTTFTFLGIAGLSYSQGAPAYYVMAYGVCAYLIGYFLAPAIWRVAKDANLLTGPDFFETRYNSRALGVAVALLWFAMIVPYVALQLSGLQILLRIAGLWRLRRDRLGLRRLRGAGALRLHRGSARHGLGQHRQRRLRLGRGDFCRHRHPDALLRFARGDDPTHRHRPSADARLTAGDRLSRHRVVRLVGAALGHRLLHGPAHDYRRLQLAQRAGAAPQCDALAALPSLSAA